MKLLIINIGASSTKLALYNDYDEVITETIRHHSSDFKEFVSLWDQYDYREEKVLDFLARHNTEVKDLDAIVSRGAVVKPLISGTYNINQEMIDDAKSGIYGIHPCGLGCEIAWKLSKHGEIPCLTVDPPCVDEMIEVAKITGLPWIKRHSVFQALNHKAKGREIAQRLNTEYDKLNLVIVHLGSGISVASHMKGRVVDITNGLEGDGPFGLDRVGTLPAADWMRFCLEGEKSRDVLELIISGNGGIKAHFGTNNAIEVEEMINEGNENAKLVYEAMAFQTAKAVGGAATVFKSKPDGIIITGGLANSKLFINYMLEMIDWIAPVYIEPDDNEIISLVQGAMRGLTKVEEIKNY